MATGPTAVVRRPYGVSEVPDLAASARLLDQDAGELAWFADTHRLERTVPEPLRHYRWTTVDDRLLAAPEPSLKEAQRRLLQHVIGPLQVHEAAHGCVPGRSVRSAATHVLGRFAWASSIDPPFGERLRAQAEQIDWS